MSFDQLDLAIAGFIRGEWRHLEWSWEGAAAVVYLAIFDDQVAGMRGFWKMAWEAGSPAAALEMHGSGDLVVEPAHRQSPQPPLRPGFRPWRCGYRLPR